MFCVSGSIALCSFSFVLGLSWLDWLKCLCSWFADKALFARYVEKFVEFLLLDNGVMETLQGEKEQTNLIIGVNVKVLIFLVYFIQILKTISFSDSLFRSWCSLMFSSVRLLIILLSSYLVTSWYFYVCWILVSHLRHSGRLNDFEVECLMMSITSISPTGSVGLFGENFPAFVRLCFAFTDCLCLGGDDEDLLLLLSSL